MRVLDGRIDFFHVHTDLGRYFDGDVDHHLQGLTHPICHVTEILPLVAAVHRFKGEHSLGTYFHILEILKNLHKLAFACKYVIINHGNLSRRLLKGCSLTHFLLPCCLWRRGSICAARQFNFLSECHFGVGGLFQPRWRHWKGLEKKESFQCSQRESGLIPGVPTSLRAKRATFTKKLYFAPKNCFFSLFWNLQKMKMDF